MIRYIIIFLGAMLVTSLSVEAQKYFTRDATVTFFSDAPLEDIEAVNESGSVVLDTENGQIEFAVLIKSFRFEKAKMQEDFNKNFMESSEYPKAVFDGQISDWESVNAEPGSTAEVNVKGNITMHGITNPLETSATLKFGETQIEAHSTFLLAVADFDIKVPSVVRKKIAEVVEVTIDVTLTPLEG